MMISDLMSPWDFCKGKCVCFYVYIYFPCFLLGSFLSVHLFCTILFLFVYPFQVYLFFYYFILFFRHIVISSEKEQE